MFLVGESGEGHYPEDVRAEIESVAHNDSFRDICQEIAPAPGFSPRQDSCLA